MKEQFLCCSRDNHMFEDFGVLCVVFFIGKGWAWFAGGLCSGLNEPASHHHQA